SGYGLGERLGRPGSVTALGRPRGQRHRSRARGERPGGLHRGEDRAPRVLTSAATRGREGGDVTDGDGRQLSGADEQERTGPLAGMLVLELGTLIAGPFAGRLLGDMGARVIKIEDPGRPDPLRT